jgi:uncharacterized protein
VIAIHDHPLGATFSVRVQPRAARTAITGSIGDSLKLTLSAPPIDDRANLELTEFLSGIFSVPRSAVQLVTGDRSRNKVIRISGRSAAELQQMLNKHFTV